MNEALLRKIFADVKQALSSIVDVATEECSDASSKLARIALAAQEVLLMIEETESILDLRT